jgi:5S rRNA maturation endonuclease (ribonuclease M5)|tara:strand:+ start:135 stop:1052 length:918 start_codon:yes stop_codon:yes gene_type:complete
MTDLRDILHKLGYTNLQDSGPVFRTKPLYRDSGNSAILCIFKNSGYFTDHGREDTKGPLEELVKITLNLKDRKEAALWLGNKYYNDKEEFVKSQSEYIEIDKIFDKENLSLIKPTHDYWNDRKISNNTLNNFQGGIDDGIEGGKMQNRYVFPIFNDNLNIIGLSGRKLEPESKRPKWIHYGQKSKWIYPSFLNEQYIKDSGEVILVESIGDMLSLWESGVKNTIVLFGVNLSKAILFYLLKLKIKKIIIALNNDGESKAGNKGAEKILDTLDYYFTKNNSSIALPYKNDFNDMTKQEITEWRQNA